MYNVNRKTLKNNVRNRIEQSRLEAELKIIEKEHKNELRMHESEAQRFRAKFSKMSTYSNSFSEAAGVKMYQTHNPGFCYKRNGDHKTPPTISSVPSLNFKQLRKLLFSGDELDIDKILCLYMLSSHRTESLRMPCMKKLREMSKENCPVERLIQRSKKINKERKEGNEILKLLPTYIIDVAQYVSATTVNTSRDETEEKLFSDARLNSRLIINRNIEEILISALGALKASNRDKFSKIINNCKDPLYLKKIFSKLSIQEFLKMLRTYSIITSCESYYLTPKIKQPPIHLEIRTIFGHLESIVRQIRKYVLQPPSKMKNEWKMHYDSDQNLMEDDMISLTSQRLVLYDEPKSSRSTYVRKSSKSVVSKQSVTPKLKSEYLERTGSSVGRRAYKNFITRNILAVKGESLTRKVFEDVELDQMSVNTFTTDMTSNILSRDYFPPNLKRYVMPPIISNIQPVAETTDSEEKEKLAKKEENEEQLLKIINLNNSSFIKKTNCYACQEKWKIPLPSPKIPRYKRPGLTTELCQNPYKTNQLNQLSSMINEELYKLNSYDNRYSLEDANLKIRLPRNPKPPSAPQNEIPVTASSVEISPFDLAKIGHEIADKEVDKKLDEFLQETV